MNASNTPAAADSQTASTEEAPVAKKTTLDLLKEKFTHFTFQNNTKTLASLKLIEDSVQVMASSSITIPSNMFSQLPAPSIFKMTKPTQEEMIKCGAITMNPPVAAEAEAAAVDVAKTVAVAGAQKVADAAQTVPLTPIASVTTTPVTPVKSPVAPVPATTTKKD